MDAGAAMNANKKEIAQVGKTKSQLKAERREKQEKERAAKAAKKLADGGLQDGGKGKSSLKISTNVLADDPKVKKRKDKKLEKQQVPIQQEEQKKVGLFYHLQQYDRSVSITKKLSMGKCNIHPAVIRLGLQYAEGMVSGSNARCVALIYALKSVIRDYETPPEKEISRHLDTVIKPCISFLNQCRPLSISMGNTIKTIKLKITKMGAGIPDEKAKEELCEFLDKYLNENIYLAAQAISDCACKKINKGDVVLVFGGSSLITKVLIDAKQKYNKEFSVIVADARPRLSGINVSMKLLSNNIPCTYVLLNAVTFILPQVTKVLLGSHGLLSNGYVMSAVGTALIALAAKMRNIPVLVCCETYKFCERVQTDAVVNNEIGDPTDLLQSPSCENSSIITHKTWKELDALRVLHLTYDVTPPSLVDAVITEQGMIPCSSVPVVLRLKNAIS